jgi:hypothetical protein
MWIGQMWNWPRHWSRNLRWEEALEMKFAVEELWTSTVDKYCERQKGVLMAQKTHDN